MSEKIPFIKTGKILIFLCVMVLGNVPVLLWQGYAWVTMIQDRLPSMGIEAALVSTFSGEAPCSHCLNIQKEQKKEKEKNPVPETRELPKFFTTVSKINFSFPANRNLWPLPVSQSPGNKLVFDIPLPPPQLLFL